MTFRRITQRDNPGTIAKRTAECDDLITKALSLANKLAKHQSLDVRTMIASARGRPCVDGYKAAAIEYPNPKYKSTWISNWPWNLILSFSVEELAEDIIRTAKHNLYASKHKLYTRPSNDSPKDK